jgi:hypothetical protein
MWIYPEGCILGVYIAGEINSSAGKSGIAVK